MTYKFTKQDIEKAIEITSENGSPSMRQAAIYLNVKYDTFRKYAQMFGLWKPNPGSKGRYKPIYDSIRKIPLDDILAGNQPQYQSYDLKNRLIKEKGWKRICSCCNLENWLGKPIPLELDHIDGNRFNHKEKNLRLLCANCHALTDTYCGKNKGSYNN